MGKLLNGVESYTEKAQSSYTSQPAIKQTLQVANAVESVVHDAATIASRAILLSLSNAWIGIGVVKPADTEQGTDPSSVATNRDYKYGTISETPIAARFDTSKMWSVKFGDYFMPLSQTYTVQASKKLNVSSLVDGIDIIQQTRKEAKTIDCTLKISVNEAQKNLQISTLLSGAKNTIVTLQEMLSELYEKDIVFLVDNETLNDTLGISWAIMTKYRFMPRPGSKTYVFEFSLMEVKFGDDILTFDEKQIQAPEFTT